MSTITHERTETQKKIDATVLERVKRGIAWLEEQHGPDWVDHIDMETLNLRSGYACVLGQLYGDEASEFDNGYEVAMRKFWGPEWTAADHAFSVTLEDLDKLDPEYDQAWMDLNDAWHQVLTPMVERSHD